MIVLLPLVYFGLALLESEILLIIALAFMSITVLVSGTLAIVLAGVSRLRGIWAIVGLATGIISLMVAMAVCGFLVLELL
jgi:hypothetical protein